MHRASSAPPAVYNRLRAVLLHVPFYTSDTLARLANDTGLSKPTIWRYANLKKNPPPTVAGIIARAISRRSQIDVRPRDIFSRTGHYQIASACQLMGCKGCLPPQAWDGATDTFKPEWQHRRPGGWSHQDCDYWHYEEADEPDGLLELEDSLEPQVLDEYQVPQLNNQKTVNHQKPGEWCRLEADPTHLV